MQAKRGICVLSITLAKRNERISSRITHKEWKYYQGIIHNTYHGGNIETYHHVLCSIPEDMENHFVLPNFTTPVPGTLRKVLDKDTTTREKGHLKGLNMTKGESGGLYMMIKTGMEVSQYYTVFNYGSPIPQ